MRVVCSPGETGLPSSPLTVLLVGLKFNPPTHTLNDKMIRSIICVASIIDSMIRIYSLVQPIDLHACVIDVAFAKGLRK